MSGFVERVWNSLPQEQRTVARTYSGWISVFMVRNRGYQRPFRAPCCRRRQPRRPRLRAGRSRGRQERGGRRGARRLARELRPAVEEAHRLGDLRVRDEDDLVDALAADGEAVLSREG